MAEEEGIVLTRRREDKPSYWAFRSTGAMLRCQHVYRATLLQRLCASACLIPICVPLPPPLSAQGNWQTHLLVVGGSGGGSIVVLYITAQCGFMAALLALIAYWWSTKDTPNDGSAFFVVLTFPFDGWLCFSDTHGWVFEPIMTFLNFTES